MYTKFKDYESDVQGIISGVGHSFLKGGGGGEPKIYIFARGGQVLN